MAASFGMWQLQHDPWRGRQPSCQSLVRLGPNQFGLAAKLPSGDPVTVQLAPGLPAEGWWVGVSVDCDDPA
jgi:hypothetical protein